MPVSVRASPSVPLCVSGIVRAVHESFSLLGRGRPHLARRLYLLVFSVTTRLPSSFALWERTLFSNHLQ